MKHATVPLHWLTELEGEVKPSGIVHSAPNQLEYSIILFEDIVVHEMMQLVVLIELTLRIRVLFSDYTKRP